MIENLAQLCNGIITLSRNGGEIINNIKYALCVKTLRTQLALLIEKMTRLPALAELNSCRLRVKTEATIV
jgi:hypothetical protein